MYNSVDPARAQAETIASYNANIGEYIAKRKTQTSRTTAFWPGVKFFLAQLEQGQTIFEIGSGTGNDAEAMEDLGFVVDRTDASEAMIKFLNSSGHKASLYDVLQQDMPDGYNAVFANAVLLHFNVGQFKIALRNIRSGLQADCLLCIGMKLGDFEGWRENGLSDKRFFKFWHTEDLETTLAESRFETINTHVTELKDYVIITARAVE